MLGGKGAPPCSPSRELLRAVPLHSPGEGGGLRSAIYLNLPQFYRNFSVMPLFKNFNFPPRKNLSLSAVTRHTICVCVLICPACHLCGTMLVCFCVPSMVSTFGDGDCGKGKRPVKRDKGQGGQKARYATQMTPAARAAQYPNEPFMVKQTDAAEAYPCPCPCCTSRWRCRKEAVGVSGT